MRSSLVAVTILAVCVCCSSCSDQRIIEVRLASDHPWETVSGRRMWYTLVWNCGKSTGKAHLSIGQRSALVSVPCRQNTVFAAYPLGTGFPAGGASNPVEMADTRILLDWKQGNLATVLLALSNRHPEPVARLNYGKVWQTMEQFDAQGAYLDWNRLCRDIVEHSLDEDSFHETARTDVVLEALPPGCWTCANPMLPSVYGFAEQPVVALSLPAGITSYLNLEAGCELRIVVPEQAGNAEQQLAPFWHVVRMDSLFLLSDAAYQDLLETGRTSATRVESFTLP